MTLLARHGFNCDNKFQAQLPDGGAHDVAVA